MEHSKSGLRKRHVAPSENGQADARHTNGLSQMALNSSQSDGSNGKDATDETVWGKTSDGTG